MRTPWGLRRRDDGATLIIVLIVVAVVSAVMSVILSQADTNIRTTVALRDQAASNYGADGATNAILNSLKTSGVTCDNPTPTPTPLGSVPSPFYAPDSSQQGPLNAAVVCTPDAINGASTSSATAYGTSTITATSTKPYLGQGDPTLPTYGLLAVGTGANDYGIDFSQSAAGTTICVTNGSVGSNKDIDVSGSNQVLAVRLDPKVTGVGTMSDCTTGTGVASDGTKLIVTAAGQCKRDTNGKVYGFTPTDCTPSSPQIATPDAPPVPSTITATDPPVVCNTTVKNTVYAAFKPGRYTTPSVLSTPCGAGSSTNVIEWLSPGTYFFDFSASSQQWAWPTALVAGTPAAGGVAISGLDPNVSSSLTKLALMDAAPKACIAPNWTSATSSTGAQLIFAGGSTAQTNAGGYAQICASASTSSPPVAIYGLPTATTVTDSNGARTLPAETLCTASGCGLNSLLSVPSSGQPELHFEGFVYAPNAQLYMTLKNSVGQVFDWGIVVRDFRLFVNGVSPNVPFIDLPRPDTGAHTDAVTSTSTVVAPTATSTSVKYSIRYVNVWTCTVADMTKNGWAQCPTGGTPNVQVKVQWDGTTFKILSWNHIR